MPVIPAWLVRSNLDDPRKIPYLLVWKDERDGEIKEAVRLARFLGTLDDHVELKRTDGVLVQREMETWRRPVSEYNAIFRGPVYDVESNGSGRKGATSQNCNWFQKGDQVGWSIGPFTTMARSTPENQRATKKSPLYTRQVSGRSEGIRPVQYVLLSVACELRPI